MATILIIDDHADTRHAMARLVKLWGHTPLDAETGEAAMAVLATQIPDLIIVDGMMPGMNGTEFIRLARTREQTASVPIVLYTAISEQAFHDDALAKGANEIWIKNKVEPSQMRERISFYMSQMQQDFEASPGSR